MSKATWGAIEIDIRVALAAINHAAMLANPVFGLEPPCCSGVEHAESLAERAVWHADALIAELNNEKDKPCESTKQP